MRIVPRGMLRSSLCPALLVVGLLVCPKSSTSACAAFCSGVPQSFLNAMITSAPVLVGLPAVLSAPLDPRLSVGEHEVLSF
jgi:hypothetical protein